MNNDKSSGNDQPGQAPADVDSPTEAGGEQRPPAEQQQQPPAAATEAAPGDESIPEGGESDTEVEIEEFPPPGQTEAEQAEEAAGDETADGPPSAQDVVAAADPEVRQPAEGAEEPGAGAAESPGSESGPGPTPQPAVAAAAQQPFVPVQVLGRAAAEGLPLPGAAGSQPPSYDPQQAARWQELLAEIERELAVLGDVPAAAPLYYEAGRIWEDKLAQLRNAWNCYNKAFQLNPKFLPNIRAAGRLAALVGNWNVAVQIIDSEIAACDDARGRAHLYHRRALYLEEKLGQIEQARQSYRQAVELEPDNLEFLKNLERLAIATGNWAEVVEVRQKMIAATSDTAVKVQLLLGCGQIQKNLLGDSDAAEQSFLQALALDSDSAEALAALRQLHAAADRHQQLVELYEREATITTEPATAAWLLYQAARLWREQLGDEERALQTLEKVLALVPDHQMALNEMAAILENLMRWQDLVDCYQKLVAVIGDRQEKVSLYYKMGTIWEEKLFNEDRALEAYRRVVELNPRYLPALQALGKLFYRKGQWAELVEMYELEIRETEDERQKAVRLYKLAEILEERLGREEDAIARLEQSLELNPGFLPVLKALGRLYSKYGRWEALIAMYEKELAVTQDHDQSVFLLDKIGSLWGEQLNNIDKAIETYQRLLEVSPNYLPAIRTLGKLYAQADRWTELIGVNEREAQLVNDQKQVVSLLHRNGEIYEEKLNDKDRAIETYKQVLALAPAYLPALQSLGRLYFVKGRWEDLIDMHRQEIEVTRNEDQQIALLYKIGQLYEEKLLQEDKAVAVYRQVLEIRPGYVPVLKSLIRIFNNKRDWPALIDIYQREAETWEDPHQKALSYFRVAEICQQHLGDDEQAVGALRRVLQLVPDHGPAIRALTELLTRRGDWRGLLEVYQQQLQAVSSERQQVLILTRMAEVLALRLGDLARAAELYEKVLTLRPDYLPALEALERILLSQRRFAGLVRVYRSLAARTSDEHLRLALHSQLADLKENRLQPAQDSGENLLAVLQVDPRHPEASRALELQYGRFGTWAGLLALYERALAAGPAPELALDLCLRAADLAENRLGDEEAAIHYYQEALRLRPDYLVAVKMLRRLRQRRGEVREVLRLLELEERALRDDKQVLELTLLRARLLLEQLNDPQAAADCLMLVLDRQPEHEAAFSQLRQLLYQQQDWERLALVLRNRLEVSADAPARAQLLVELGQITWQQLGRPQEAANLFARALQDQPANDQAVEALTELSFLAGQWQQTVEFGSRLQELTTDPQRLFAVHQRLGIVYQEKLPDPERAVQHLRRALEYQPGNLEVLERLRALHRASQDWEQVVEVCGQIAAATEDPAQRLACWLEQAQALEQGLQQPERALEVLQRVLGQEPTNVEVIQKLAELYERLERWQELIDSLQSFIRLLPPERQQEALPLHMKMAAIWHERLNNTEKAIIEYKRAVDIAPRHVAAHEALARLYGSSGLYYANAIDEHRTLLAINPFRIASYHELRRIFEEQRAFDKLLCVCAVLHYLRAADANEEFFYGENRSKVPDRSPERLSAEEVNGLLIHPRERGLVRSLLLLAGPHLSKVHPAQLERHGVGKADRARPDDPLRSLVEGMASNLGEFEVDIYLSNQPTHLVAVENTVPPSLVVGEGLVKRSVVKEQRFALGRALKLVHDGSFLALALDEQQLARLVAALVQPYQPQSPVASYPGQLPADYVKRVHKALPRKVRKALEQLLAGQAAELARVPDYQAYREAVECSADRFGLLMCNDIASAMRHRSRQIPELRDRRLNSPEEIAEALSRQPTLCELLRFAVSEEYFRLRTRLKFSLV